MAKTLVRDKPTHINKPVEATWDMLVAHIVEVDSALSERVRAKNPQIIAREIEFDRASDAMWVLFRRLLELLAQAFGHAGLELLTPERQAKLDLPKLRELAALSTTVHEQLFAAEGTAFTRSAFAAQAESMAAILRIIKEDDLEGDVHKLVDGYLLPALEVCQEQYEELVSDRMRREVGFGQDFRELRRRLRWLLDRYKVAIETLYDENDPDSYEVVEDALRSMIMLSAHMARGTTAEISEELDAAFVDAQFFDEVPDAAVPDEDADGDLQADEGLQDAEALQQGL